MPAKTDDKTIAHVLDRLGYGARPGDIEKVREMGVAKYIDQQLHPERIADRRLDARLAHSQNRRDESVRARARNFHPRATGQKRSRNRHRRRTSDTGDHARSTRMNMSPALMKARQVIVELNEQKLLRATYSERQLQEVLTDFWFNHFNVFAGKGADRQLLTAYERDVIRPNVLGNFRTLLGATAHSSRDAVLSRQLDEHRSERPSCDGAR